MARQSGDDPVTGCIDGICFYKMDGQYYARAKSSLDRQRVLHDPAFARTRAAAALLGKAAKIASAYYRTLPRDQRSLAVYRRITGEVMKALKGSIKSAS